LVKLAWVRRGAIHGLARYSRVGFDKYHMIDGLITQFQ